MRRVIGLLLPCVLALLHSTSALALESKIQLSIAPRLCSVDIVSDGSNQTMHLPEGCQKALPLPPAIVTQKEDTLSFMPTSSQTISGGLIVQSATEPHVESTLSPIIASADPKGIISQSTYLTPTILGVGLSLGVAAVGIDLALFEFQHTRKIIRWGRHAAGRLSKLYAGR